MKRTGTVIAVAALGALAAWFAFVDQGDGGVGVSAQGVETDGTVIAAADRLSVEVWKSPTCGCCSGWVTYLEEEGFEVTAHDVEDVDPIRAGLGLVDPRLRSCHTASIGGYLVEGHVPASDIERLLAERPDIIGIAAPGMPMMSPGMGSREPRNYDVISFADDGDTAVFTSH